METILVTGGAGFIGSNLVDRLLSQGLRVIVIDNFNDSYDTSLKEKNVEQNLGNINFSLYKGDIRDVSLLQRIFTENRIHKVVHLAARAGVRPSIEYPLEYINSNIYGTVNLLECMRDFNIKKIVFASSSSVYGNCQANKFSEDLRVSEPISPYAATKLAGEQFIYTYSRLYDMKAACLRFFTVYGPRQRPDLAIRKFTEQIIKGEAISIYGDGTSLRDYTYIDDIVDGVCSALKYDKTNYEIINLGGGNPITLNQAVSTIEKTLGKTAIINYLPLQQGDVNRTISDISKAKELLGYNPKVTFEEGIKNFIEWERGIN